MSNTYEPKEEVIWPSGLPHQIKNSFDNETIRKIIKGALIAMVVALLTYLVDVFSALELGYAPIVVWVLQTTLNGIREYRKGE